MRSRGGDMLFAAIDSSDQPVQPRPIAMFGAPDRQVAAIQLQGRARGRCRALGGIA